MIHVNEINKGSIVLQLFVLALLWTRNSLSFVVPSTIAQGEDVYSNDQGRSAIKGAVYVIKAIFGRLVNLYVDKNTKCDRMLVPGERIEADVVRESRRTSTGELSP